MTTQEDYLVEEKPRHNLAMTIARNTMVVTAGNGLLKVINFLFNVYVIRRLGGDHFGQYSAVLAFTATFAIFSDLGLGVYGVRQVARWRDLIDWRERSQALYSNIFSLRLILSVITSILVITAAWLTSRPSIVVWAIAINSISLILYAFQGANESLLSGLERLDAIASMRVFSQVAFVIAGTVALLVSAGFYGLIYANLFSLVILTVLCWRAIKVFGLRLVRPTPAVWMKLIKASLPFGIIGFALGLSYKFDSVLLSIYRGDLETGYYNAAYNLIFSAVMISNSLNTSIFPSLARQAVSEPSKVPAISERIFRYLMLVSLPIAVGGWVLSSDLVNFLYTNRYGPAAPALSILVWVVPLMYTSEFLGYVILIKDQERSIARAVLISSGFNGLANLLLVPRYGFIAASAMTVLTEIVLVMQYFWLLRNMLSQFNWLRTFFLPLFSTAIMGAVVLLLRPYILLPVNIAFGALVYLAGLLLFRVIRQDEYSILFSFIISRLGKRKV